MLALLVRRENKYFEGFCQALEATDQHGVVQRYLQPYRVRLIHIYCSCQCDAELLLSYIIFITL